MGIERVSQSINKDENKREKVSNIEVEETVIAAENIAKFRMELEKKIFQEGLPPTKWEKAYEESLTKYPDILPYKGLFDSIIGHAQAANEEVEKLWSKYAKGAELENEKNLLVNVADADASAKLFESVTGFKPAEEVRAYKGAITIRFHVGERDYEKLGYARGYLPGGSFHKVQMGDLLVLIVNKSYENSSHFDEIVLHELEHAKNDVFHTQYINYQRLHMSFKDPHFRKRMLRLSLENAEDVEAKDEILAYFSILEYIPDNLEEKELRESMKKIENILQKNYGFQNTKYIQEGFDAFFAMASFYQGKGLTFQKSARLTINILEQFPLARWLAVARLLKHKYQANR